MKTPLQILKERILVDKKDFPAIAEYFDSILSDINNELLPEEKQQLDKSYLLGYKHADDYHKLK